MLGPQKFVNKIESLQFEPVTTLHYGVNKNYSYFCFLQWAQRLVGWTHSWAGPSGPASGQLGHGDGLSGWGGGQRGRGGGQKGHGGGQPCREDQLVTGHHTQRAGTGGTGLERVCESHNITRSPLQWVMPLCVGIDAKLRIYKKNSATFLQIEVSCWFCFLKQLHTTDFLGTVKPTPVF